MSLDGEEFEPSALDPAALAPAPTYRRVVAVLSDLLALSVTLLVSSILPVIGWTLVAGEPSEGLAQALLAVGVLLGLVVYLTVFTRDETPGIQMGGLALFDERTGWLADRGALWRWLRRRPGTGRPSAFGASASGAVRLVTRSSFEAAVAAAFAEEADREESDGWDPDERESNQWDLDELQPRPTEAEDDDDWADLVPGSRIRRYVALFVDVIVVFGLFTLVVLGLAGSSGLALAASLLGVFVLYGPLTMGITNGRTPGMWVLRLRLVRDDGEPVTVGFALARDLNSLNDADLLAFRWLGASIIVLCHVVRIVIPPLARFADYATVQSEIVREGDDPG